MESLAAAATGKPPFETITIGTLFSGGGFMLLLTLLIRQIGPWRKQVTDETTKLIEGLGKRVESLEKQLAIKDRMHFIEIRRIEARNAAQRSLDRHKFNNSEHNLEALLRVLELSPEKAAEAARQALEARAQMKSTEKQEAALIHAAEIRAVEAAAKEFDEAIAAEESA